MKRDLRDDPRYREARAFFERVYAGSFGNLVNFQDVRASASARWIAVAGDSYDELTGKPRSRIALFDVKRTAFGMLESDRYDTCPRWSRTADTLAFISDRAAPGHFLPYVYEPDSLRVRQLAAIDGSAEALVWSPDGTRLLVQSVQAGADRAGAQGSGGVGGGDDLPAWIPDVEEAVPQQSWRRLWICPARTGKAELLDWIEATVWEAEWCGKDGLIAVVSANPREAAWFNAQLVYVDLRARACETIYQPAYQIGLPAATPDGRYAAIVEGCCSDRGIVAGDALLFDRMLAWRSRRIETNGVDVTALYGRENSSFAFAGVHDSEVAAGRIDVGGGVKLHARSPGSWLRLYPGVAPMGSDDYITVAHAYATPPALVRYGAARSNEHKLHSFSCEGSAYAAEIAGELVRRTWTAPDGLEIHGYLARPASREIHPLVVFIHGGPVWTYANSWCLTMPLVPFLVSRGYSVLLPNPRGSSGRGQTFARLVCGDMGGAEAGDILAGVQSLVDDGLADDGRIAVMGGSHGGYLSAWLVTQTDRFAAAVCAFPVTDLFSGVFTGTPSEAVPPFIASEPFEVTGQFFTRSPIMHAANVRTPVLVIAGANDRCVGISQGLEFHRALARAGLRSELVTYPQEGHGVQNVDAYIDYCTRIFDWLHANVSGARSRTS